MMEHRISFLQLLFDLEHTVLKNPSFSLISHKNQVGVIKRFDAIVKKDVSEPIKLGLR